MSSKANNGLVPAVAYLRRSTTKQEASISEQREEVKKYAAKSGYRIIREYIDDGISGDDTQKRREFRRMIADAEQGDFKAILCWDDSRFGRFDSIEAGHWIYPLREAGVYLDTVRGGKVDWDDPNCRIISGLKQEQHHDLGVKLSNDVTRGLLGAAKAGSWIGSIPYAYRLEGPKKNKRLILNDISKQRIVERIFREFVEEGRSMTSIAARLNKDGVASPGGRGKPWRFDTVKVILENPAYCGDVVSGRWSYGKYNTIRKGAMAKVARGDRKRCRKPLEECIIHRDHHEAIVDRAMYNKAQALLAIRKTGRKPRTPESTPYLLNDKLICGQCGNRLWGEDFKRRTYECSRAKYHRDCPGCRVKESEVLRCIATHLHEEFRALDGGDEARKSKASLSWKAERHELRPSDIPLAFAKIKKLIMPRENPRTDQVRLERQLKKLDADLARGRSNLVLLKAENIPAAEDRIGQMVTEREEIVRELSHKPPTEREINTYAMEVFRSLNLLAAAFASLADPPEEYHDGLELSLDDLPAGVRRWLAAIESVTIHTKRVGHGNGTRYEFIDGVIRLSTVGLTTVRENPHPPG